ncbi:hypothetical protein LEP1GSC086_0110 [Leptospira weilii str. LNT 1234]|nr:hypothetical protein LEP1GSC086_0110 [Leptospira weilii str. LNT 1234]
MRYTDCSGFAVGYGKRFSGYFNIPEFIVFVSKVVFHLGNVMVVQSFFKKGLESELVNLFLKCGNYRKL